MLIFADPGFVIGPVASVIFDRQGSPFKPEVAYVALAMLVVLFPFPDLSLHWVTFDPERETVDVSVASSHKAQFENDTGLNMGTCVNLEADISRKCPRKFP
jgi:hypothetical protein